jgi:hypothetical protein
MDVSWTAGVPLWTALSPAGQVIDAGAFADWSSSSAARLGSLPLLSRPAPEPLPRPHELPGGLEVVAGPTLPPQTSATEPNLSTVTPTSVPSPQLKISSPTPPGLTLRPEPQSPPIATQATNWRPPTFAMDRQSSAAPVMPVADAIPAARLVMPKP